MDEYPDDFTRATCMQTMTNNQHKMVQDTRELFFKKITETSDTCAKSVELIFPALLWQENRAILANELLQRFGEIHVLIKNGYNEIKRQILTSVDLPKDISSIVIEFWK